MIKRSPIDFSPPTYFEFVAGTPYRALVGGVKYVTYHQSAFNWINFFTVKQRALDAMKKATEDQSANIFEKQKILYSGVIIMIELLWSIRHQTFFEKIISFFRGDKSKFHNFLITNNDELFRIFEQVMDFNGRLLRWTRTPSQLQSHSISSMVEGDFYRDWFEGKEPKTTKYLALLHAREIEKEKIIRTWEMSEKQKRENKGKHHGR